MRALTPSERDWVDSGAYAYAVRISGGDRTKMVIPFWKRYRELEAHLAALSQEDVQEAGSLRQAAEPER